MTIEAYMEELTAQERLQFQKTCRSLLKHTFLLRDMDENSKRDYFFIYRNRDLFEAYMGLMGFDVVTDTATGVVMLANQAAYGSTGGVQTNRLRLKKRESILLCCLWLLYSRRLMAGGDSMSLVIDKSELDMQLEEFGASDLFDKGTMVRTLDLFSSYYLIKVVGRVGDVECKLVLYPSLQFCMEEGAFADFVSQTRERMSEPADLLQEDLTNEGDGDEE